jgi:hypothetical protein
MAMPSKEAPKLAGQIFEKMISHLEYLINLETDQDNDFIYKTQRENVVDFTLTPYWLKGACKLIDAIVCCALMALFN